MKQKTKILLITSMILSSTVLLADKESAGTTQAVAYANQSYVVHYDNKRNTTQDNIVHYDNKRNAALHRDTKVRSSLKGK